MMIVICNYNFDKFSAVSLNMLISVVCGKAIQTKNKELVNSYVVARMIDSVERLSTGNT